MFGHRDDQASDQDNDNQPDESANEEVVTAGAAVDTADDQAVAETPEPETAEPSTIVTPDPLVDAPEPDAPEASETKAEAASAPEDTPSSAPAVDTEIDPPADKPDWQHPGEPLDTGPEQISDVISPAGGFPKPPSFKPFDPADHGSPSPHDDDAVSEAAHELIDIKQTALTELAPLIDELDQTPEDKFRTLMMMIQASDDQSMVKKAYAAAHSIEDEKTRAQALLDIVNEINYFTQPHDDAN